MKKSSLPALFLALALLAGCGSKPAETTAPSNPPVTQPPQTQATEPPTEPGIQTDRFSLNLPEGFALQTEEKNRWVYASPDAPEDPSTVTVELLPREEAVLTMSASDYTKRLDTTGEPESEALRFKLIDLWTERIDGCTTAASEYNLVYEDYITHILRYELVSEIGNVIFTFSDGTDDNRWLTEFAGCAGTVRLNREGGMVLDYSHLTAYTLDCGISLYAEPDLIELDSKGFTECLGNRSAVILFMADDKEANHLTGMEMADYAQLLQTTNELPEFATDLYGNWFTTFRTTSNGTEYYNMLFLKETRDAFWVCQMACNLSQQEDYQTQFPLWASSIIEIIH